MREEIRLERKRVGIEKEPRELAPIAIPEEEASNEEMGDFEAYAEQPVLSLLQTRANQLKLELKKGENKKLKLKRATFSELALLKEMKEE